MSVRVGAEIVSEKSAKVAAPLAIENLIVKGMCNMITNMKGICKVVAKRRNRRFCLSEFAAAYRFM